ncbi:unnamed protein product [Alopecurus aequalis]
MLRLRSCVLTHPVSSLLRLLSAAAPADSPNPSFAVKEYLVGTCGLTRPQALKASTKLSHLKSPSKPDAVLAFLAGLGLSSADVAAVVAKDPQFLCAKVGKTLASNFVRLTGLGLSPSEVTLAPGSFRLASIVSNLPYYLSLFGSYHNILRALKRCPYDFLSADLDRVVKPNVAFLRECGVDACDIAKLCILQPRWLTSTLERLQAIVACAERLGVPRGSGMFRLALQAVGFYTEETIAAKVDILKKMFSWSDAEVAIAVSKHPSMLNRSKETLQHMPDFLINKVGLGPAYIAHRPVMLTYSLEGRIRPRYYVLKFLKEKGLVHQHRDYYAVLVISNKAFMEKFICPHKKVAPHLAEYYAAACSGEVPTRFKFT